MKETVSKNCFSIGKLICMAVFITHQVVMVGEELGIKAFHGMYLALFFFATILLEMSEYRRVQYGMLVLEGILSVGGVFLFPVTGVSVMMIALADLYAVLRAQPAYYFSLFILVIPYVVFGGNIEVAIGLTTFFCITYIQEKTIIRKYRDEIQYEEFLQTELKVDMEKQTKSHEAAMKKTHLEHENQMLEEKSRISQALHDKLGHSINGSIYQLEAAKLLIDKKPEEGKVILQGVIDQLRISMDEIRLILRREKPDKKRMALLSLQMLCDECEKDYHIKIHLYIDDVDEKIPEKTWEVILDNTYEAVTNALKYAKCRNIYIDIIAMNEIVRCTIRDDGKGCSVVEDGMGISGMKERARNLKGYISIESEIGFTINMVLPMK